MGIVYDIAVNTPVRWFDKRRGMATGAVSMAFSGTSFVLIPFIDHGVESAFVPTLLVLAGAAGGTSLVAAAILRDPDTTEPEQSGVTKRNTETAVVTWRTMVRTRQFWFLYIVFTIVNGVGLMLIEKVVAYANQLGLSPVAATAAASLVALGQGTGVLMLGAVSDRLGRERTLAVSLVLCGGVLAATVVAGQLALE